MYQHLVLDLRSLMDGEVVAFVWIDPCVTLYAMILGRYLTAWLFRGWIMIIIHFSLLLPVALAKTFAIRS